MKKLLGLLIFLMILFSQISPLTREILSPEALETTPDFFKTQFIEPSFQAGHINKKPGHYTRKDWEAAIDSTWGKGLPAGIYYCVLKTESGIKTVKMIKMN